MQNLRKILPQILFISIIFIFISCDRGSNNNAKIVLHRYEKALMEIPVDSMKIGLESLLPEYAIYLEGADLADTVNIMQMRAFVSDPLVKELYSRVDRFYGNEDVLQIALGGLFMRASELFKEDEVPFVIPEVYTYISCFDYQNRIIYMDSIISISIDMYLPEQTEFYVSSGLPRYIAARLQPDFLSVDVARAIALARLNRSGGIKNLLEEIVYQGKVMCMLDYMLPKLNEETKLAYTPQQWEWCKKNEKGLWDYILKEQLLYSDDLQRIKNYVNDGPEGMAFEGAPSRLSQFIGWRMFSAYLRKTTKTGVEVWEAPADEVLRVSGYKP